jgi:uncharacterized protein YigE (DUF2233 family)
VQAQDLAWDQLHEGLAIMVWESASVCPDVPALLSFRIDPERLRFSIHQFHDEGLAGPLTIQEWRQRTGALLVFNAGLFREDYSYIGLLYKDGRQLGSKRHRSWQGLFVAEPTQPGLQKARVLDLAYESFQEDPPQYREVAQSLMLLDRGGKPRVRDSGKRAYQTAVGEDSEGKIWVIKTTNEVSLHDLAACLRRAFPALRQVMAMDGGSSSDLAVASSQIPVRINAKLRAAWQGFIESPGLVHTQLPAVIAVSPRATAAADRGPVSAR